MCTWTPYSFEHQIRSLRLNPPSTDACMLYEIAFSKGLWAIETNFMGLFSLFNWHSINPSGLYSCTAVQQWRAQEIRNCITLPKPQKYDSPENKLLFSNSEFLPAHKFVSITTCYLLSKEGHRWRLSTKLKKKRQHRPPVPKTPTWVGCVREKDKPR